MDFKTTKTKIKRLEEAECQVETNLSTQRRTIINVTTTDMLKAERERNESEIELIKEKRALMELEAREGGRLHAYENKRRRLDNPANRPFFRR